MGRALRRWFHPAVAVSLIAGVAVFVLNRVRRGGEPEGVRPMTPDEALDLAVHVYGTSSFCGTCQIIRYFDEYKRARPEGAETDLAFGQWLLQEGWQFSWEEFDNGGWDFEFYCPACAAKRAAP